MTQQELFNHITGLNLKEGQKLHIYHKNSTEPIEVCVTYQYHCSTPDILHFLSNNNILDGYNCNDTKGYKYSYVLNNYENIEDLFNLGITIIVNPDYKSKDSYSLTF